MQYDVITFDTQTVISNAFHFDGGLLAQLKQFKNGPVRVVLSEVVLREIVKHLVQNTRAAKDSIISAHKKAVDHGLAEANAPFIAADVDVKSVARARLTKFLQEIGAEIIRPSNISVSDLVEAYFQPAPPFSAAGKNKAEFPDAMALMSLERWANENNRKVLAVSNDKGWTAFAELSDRIDVHAELTEALALLQKHEEEARAAVQSLFTAIDTNSDAELALRFKTLLADEISGYGADADANSAYSIEADQLDLSLIEFRFVGDPDDFSFSVTQSGPNVLVAQADIETTVKAETVFYMSVYDSIDKDHTPVGSTQVKMDEEALFEVLATFERDSPSTAFRVSKVEIVDGPTTISFGDVAPDYDQEPEDDYEIPDDAPDGEDDEVPSDRLAGGSMPW
jgi:hypothetical protein